MQIAEVPQEQVPAVWPHIEGLVDMLEAKTHGEHTHISLAKELSNGHRLWIAYDEDRDRAIGFTTTFMVQDGSDRMIGIMLAGVGETGKGSEWVQPMRDTIKDYFREQGCYKYSFIGPRAWGKFFPDMKFKRAVFEGDL